MGRGRGKIQMKYIQNSANRHVTFSKRRTGILKKATELSILCDAQVCLLMFAETGKIAEYVSPSTTMKAVFDKYQDIAKVDLWASEYERMQKELRTQKEINFLLRRNISQRTGQHDLNGISYRELRALEEDLHHSLETVRLRKNDVLARQIETTKKNIRHFERAQKRYERSLYGEREQQGSHLNAAAPIIGGNNEGNNQTGDLYALQLFTSCFPIMQPSQAQL